MQGRPCTRRLDWPLPQGDLVNPAKLIGYLANLDAMVTRVFDMAQVMNELRGATLGHGEESYAANPRGVEPASRVEVAEDL